jgi:putative ABC transport system permease protein
MTVTLAKLAFAGIRSRALASLLTILLAGVATATLVLALEVGATARDPWQRTFDAAHGAHVLLTAPSEADTRRAAAGDSELSVSALATPNDDLLQLVGLPSSPRINAPVRTAGARPGDGGIVLERSFAEALGLKVGSRLRAGPRELPVIGIAITPSQPRYPRSKPGLGWVTRGTFERIVPDRSRWRWTQAVRLHDPATAPAVAQRAAAAGLSARTWEEQRADALRDAEPVALILTTYTIVLLVVVFAVVAILVAARAGQQHREIGLLKAVGLTPRQVTTVFALETAALGLVAAVIGFAAGALLAPRLAKPSTETMLGSPTVAANPWHLVIAGVPVLLVLVASTRGATRRSTRFSALQAIEAGTPAPAPRSRLVRTLFDAPLPVPLALGLKDLLGRGRRARRLAGAVAVTGAAIVFALSMQASLDARPAGEPSDVPSELPVLVYSLDAVLLVITGTTLVALVLLSVRERIRDYGVLKAIGLTPQQLTSSVVSAYAALSLLAAVASIPLGLALYVAVYALAGGDAEDRVLAPWHWLALVPLATLVFVAAATSVPARLATRISSADALRYE